MRSLHSLFNNRYFEHAQHVFSQHVFSKEACSKYGLLLVRWLIEPLRMNTHQLSSQQPITQEWR